MTFDLEHFKFPQNNILPSTHATTAQPNDAAPSDKFLPNYNLATTVADKDRSIVLLFYEDVE